MGLRDDQVQTEVLTPVDVRGREAAALKRPAFSARRAAAFVLFNLAAVVVLILLCEGAASVYYAFHAAFVTPPYAESLHTKYDPELGWVNLRNVYRPNMYGPGIFLKTNSQGFRNNADFTPRVPLAKTRIICSGDSFTLGFGVDNDHTWCQLLTSRGPNIETVNMGQGGYGADQIYLWYKRDGVRLDHDIHLVVLSSPDIYRMQHTQYNGYGKPTLTVENDRVVATNVPVPRSMEVWAPRLLRADNALSQLSITRLLRSKLKLDRAAPEAPRNEKNEKNEETAWVLEHMLDDLRETNVAKHSVLVLAYLPVREELALSKPMSWRNFLSEYAQQHGLPYLDITDALRKLPPVELDKIFITRAAVDLPGVVGHYSETGNAFIADFFYRGMLANRDTAAALHSQPIEVH